MTRLALIRLSDASVIAAPIAEGMRVELPGVGFVSPAVAGWQGGGVITYSTPEGGSEIAEEGPPQFALLPIIDFAVPDGKCITGGATYAIDGASVTETFPTENIPLPEPDPTPLEKLAAVGLTVDDLRMLLGIE